MDPSSFSFWRRRLIVPTPPKQTAYSDSYSRLNPHLFGDSFREYVRPALVASDAVRASLQRTFKFADHMFSAPHTVIYPALRVQADGPANGRIVLDANYMWSTEYYHFIMEVLPNVIAMSRAYPTGVIRCRVSAFTRAMLDWFGVQNHIEPAVSVEGARRIHVPAFECGNPSPERVGILRDIVKSRVTFSSTHGILIRRHGSRVLVNEAEVLDQLKAKYPSLEWVIFDAETVPDTAALFARAAVIAGPHGAGFTNMLFSPPDVEVIEFMPESDANACYWHLAAVLGLSYTMVSTPVVGPSNAMLGRLPA